MLLVLSLIALALKLAPSPARSLQRVSYATAYVDCLRHPGALAMIAFGLLSHVFWHGFQTYAGTFYQVVHGLSVGELAPIFTAAGLGIMAGNMLGGRVALRVGNRWTAIGATLVTSVLIAAQISLPIPLLAAVALHVIWSIPNGGRMPAANALLTEVLPERRGTVVGLNSAASSAGTLIGASVGGVILGSEWGLSGLGALCALFAILSASVLWLFVREERPAA